MMMLLSSKIWDFFELQETSSTAFMPRRRTVRWTHVNVLQLNFQTTRGT